MPAKTPRAADAQVLTVSGRPDMKFVADALADNLRAYRLLSQLEQQDVAERMRRLGHPWRRVTTSEVERGRRNVTVPELLTLTLVLGVTVQDLLDPRRPDQRDGPGIMFLALTPEATGFPISSDHLTGHLCLHVYRVGPIEWPDNDLHPGVSGVQYQRVAPEGVEQP